MEEVIKNYFQDEDNKINLQQKLDEIYYKVESNKTTESYRIACEIEKIMDDFPKLRGVFEDEKITSFNEQEVKALIKLQILHQKQYNEMENIAYYTGVKDVFELLKKIELI